MKKILLLLSLFSITFSCSVKDKNSVPLNNPELSKMEKYIAREDISVYDESKRLVIFIIEDGEIFFGETAEERGSWQKINLEGRVGYIQPSTKAFPVSPYMQELKYEKNFLVINQRGIPLCQKPPQYGQCDVILKKLNYLEKLSLVKPLYMMYTGKWLKVKQNDLIGFVPLIDTIPEDIFNLVNVNSFKNNFHKICPLKKLIIYKDTYTCYSAKKFLNGDAGEIWEERVYFTVDELSNKFGYGRKYLETNGLIFNVELVSKGTYKVYYLDYNDYNEESFLVEFNFDKKVIYAPLPETLMKGANKQLSVEKVELKNVIKY